MKKILQVAKFEYLNCVKNKGFIITTAIILGLILIMSFVPSIVMSIQSNQSDDEETIAPQIAVLDTAYNNKNSKVIWQTAYQGYDVQFSDKNVDDIKKKVDNGDYRFGIVINSPLSFQFVTKNNSMFNTETETISNTLKYIYQSSELAKKGVGAEESAKILSPQIQSAVITTGTNQTQNYITTYIIIMLLYVAIMMYGSMVSQSVVSEKNTRAMEMLITCAKPTHLMFGKVIGSGLAGLTQLVLICGTGLVAVNSIASSAIPSEIREMISLPMETVIYAVIFFILGYFIYSFLLGALSSFASRSEDLNTLISPVMMLYMVAFFIVIICLNSDRIDSTLMVVCSYIPFTAPIVMFTRIAMSNVAFYEIAISIAVQLVSIYVFGLFAAAVYRIGVLMYGKPPKFGEIFRLLREQHKSNKKIKSGE